MAATHTSASVVIGDNFAVVVIVSLMFADTRWSLFHPRNQTLHDKLAQTIAVNAYTLTG